MLKESKILGEKKEERRQDTMRERYLRAANTNTIVKQTSDHDPTPDFYSPASATALES